MKCGKCGYELGPNDVNCPKCGAPAGVVVKEQNNSYVNQHQGPMVNGKSVIVWGSLGLGFACTFYLSFLGIIFSAIGLNKAGQFAKLSGQLYGMAKAGKIMSVVGLVLGIVLTLAFLLWLITIILLVG